MPLTPKEFSTIALDIADIVPIAKSSDKSLLETITFKATVLVLFPVIESAFITPDEISTSILISELAVAFNSPDKLIVSIFPFCKSTVELANNKSLAFTVESLPTVKVELLRSNFSDTLKLACSFNSILVLFIFSDTNIESSDKITSLWAFKEPSLVPSILSIEEFPPILIVFPDVNLTSSKFESITSKLAFSFKVIVELVNEIGVSIVTLSKVNLLPLFTTNPDKLGKFSPFAKFLKEMVL